MSAGYCCYTLCAEFIYFMCEDKIRWCLDVDRFWFKSYLTSRSFRVKCDLSSKIFFLWCSSRLCSRSSTFRHTTPLSTFISTISLNHHLYADDTLILNFFLILFSRNFDSSIAHFLTALRQISSLVSTNLLTLNASKTEFLIIGLKQQLSKIDTTPHSIPLILHATQPLMSILLFLYF